MQLSQNESIASLEGELGNDSISPAPGPSKGADHGISIPILTYDHQTVLIGQVGSLSSILNVEYRKVKTV